MILIVGQRVVRISDPARQTNMSPCVPEEVDVFSVPHSRMKELVDDYYEKVTCLFRILY